MCFVVVDTGEGVKKRYIYGIAIVCTLNATRCSNIGL
jgi:hypothetical protein